MCIKLFYVLILMKGNEDEYFIITKLQSNLKKPKKNNFGTKVMSYIS